MTLAMRLCAIFLLLPVSVQVSFAEEENSKNLAPVYHLLLQSGDEFGWSDHLDLSLTWTPPTTTPAQYSLDAADLTVLVPDSTAHATLIMELPMGDLIGSSLDSMLWACGSDWWLDDVTFACPTGWNEAQLNLFRLLSMTPANVNLAGTSLAGLIELAETLSSLGIVDNEGELLALIVGKGLYDTLLSLSATAAALNYGLVATHPNATASGLLGITLSDVLSDMATFTPRYDSTGGHPGLWGTQGSVSAEILTDGFAVSFDAVSNLHQHQGVNLDQGALNLMRLADTTGPTFDDLFEFDFEQPTVISGVANNPFVNLVLALSDSGEWPVPGTSVEPTPHGNSTVWGLDSWYLESIFSASSFTTFETLLVGCDLCTGASSGAALIDDPLTGIDHAEFVVGRSGYDKDVLLVGQDGIPEHFALIAPNPPGWLRTWTLYGLQDPVDPQYVWDALVDIVRQRLIDAGESAGSITLQLALDPLDVGLTTGQVDAVLRPVLDGLQPELGDYLAGNYVADAAGLDFFLAKGDDTQLYLYFVAPSDAVPAGTANHATPGFFSDPELSIKVSTVDPGSSGDSIHEKLPVQTAQTVYCQSNAGMVYRLEIDAAEENTVAIRVSKRLP